MPEGAAQTVKIAVCAVVCLGVIVPQVMHGIDGPDVTGRGQRTAKIFKPLPHRLGVDPGKRSRPALVEQAAHVGRDRFGPDHLAALARGCPAVRAHGQPSQPAYPQTQPGQRLHGGG